MKPLKKLVKRKRTIKAIRKADLIKKPPQNKKGIK